MLSSIEVSCLQRNAAYYCEERHDKNSNRTVWLFVLPLLDMRGNFFYYTEGTSNCKYRITGDGMFVTDEYTAKHLEMAFAEWYRNISIAHYYPDDYVLLDTFPEYDRDYCNSFAVTREWLSGVLENDESVNDYLSLRASWDENYIIYLRADAEGAIIFKEQSETGQNMLYLLGRLRSDCVYYLTDGMRNPDVLWEHDEKKHISKMKELYLNLPSDRKPTWLTEKEIGLFETMMDKD